MDESEGEPLAYTDADFAADIIHLRKMAAGAADTSGIRYVDGERRGHLPIKELDEMFGLANDDVTRFCRLLRDQPESFSDAMKTSIEAALYDMFTSTGSSVLQGFAQKARGVLRYVEAREGARLARVVARMRARFGERSEEELRKFVPAAPMAAGTTEAEGANEKLVVAMRPAAEVVDTQPNIAARAGHPGTSLSSERSIPHTAAFETATKVRRGDLPAVRAFRLSQFAATEPDGIAMSPGVTADSRLKIDEISYTLRSSDDQVDLRVGLSGLCIRWIWGDEAHVAMLAPCDREHGRVSFLQSANPSLVVLGAGKDVGTMRVRVRAKGDRAAFAPRERVAVESFEFPLASIADGSQHSFSIWASKMHLCLGRWNEKSQVFEELVLSGDTLRSADETSRLAAELALVEVRNGFPADGADKHLGTRQATVVYAAAEPDEQDRKAVR